MEDVAQKRWLGIEIVHGLHRLATLEEIAESRATPPQLNPPNHASFSGGTS